MKKNILVNNDVGLREIRKLSIIDHDQVSKPLTSLKSPFLRDVTENTRNEKK